MPFDFDYTTVDPTKDRARPRFHFRAIQSMEKSEAAGHPVFRDVEYVEVFLPANDRERPCYRVRPEDRNRWPRQYEAFLKGNEAKSDGFPLEEWSVMTKAVVETFKAVGIFALEDLVAATDDDLQRMGPQFVNLKRKAQIVLDENTVEKRQIEQLQKQNELLEKRLAALEDTPKKPDNMAKARAAKAAKAKEKKDGEVDPTGDEQRSDH